MPEKSDCDRERASVLRRVPVSHIETLDRIARANALSRGDLVRIAIARYLSAPTPAIDPVAPR